MSERKPLVFVENASPAPGVAVTKAPALQERKQQVGARVPAVIYRQLKASAALQGMTVQTLVEQVITEYLANHPQ